MFTFSAGLYELAVFTFSKVYADAHHTVQVVMTKIEVLVCSQPFCQQLNWFSFGCVEFHV